MGVLSVFSACWFVVFFVVFILMGRGGGVCLLCLSICVGVCLVRMCVRMRVLIFKLFLSLPPNQPMSTSLQNERKRTQPTSPTGRKPPPRPPSPGHPSSSLPEKVVNLSLIGNDPPTLRPYREGVARHSEVTRGQGSGAKDAPAVSFYPRKK